MVDNDVATGETSRLIASNKSRGPPSTRDGDKLGSVHNFMVDKRSGRVEYAVLSFGSMFGMGGDFYPQPLFRFRCGGSERSPDRRASGPRGAIWPSPVPPGQDQAARDRLT